MASGVVRKVRQAAGLVAAPWFFLAGKGLESSRLYQISLAADPQYIRATMSGIARDRASPLHIGQFQIAALLAAEATLQGAEDIKRLLALSESQILQDIFCILVLDRKQLGYFVEVGVGSGKAISNTYMLEKHFGWSGILIEPNRSSHNDIAACRSAKLERRAAASRSGAMLTFHEVVGAGEHSRIAGTGGHELRQANIEEYPVETVTLDQVLSENGAPREIDYLSLDTEGSEIDILKGLDLDMYQFKVMTIEHNHDRATLSRLRKMLEPHGYRAVFDHVSGFDVWFVHKNIDPTTFPGMLL